MKLVKSMTTIGLLTSVLAWPVAGTIIHAENTPASNATAGSVNKIPQAAADHAAMAKTYLEKAAQYRQEAALHRKMLADYIKANTSPLKTQPGEKSWVKKMRIHCEKYIKDAESLAVEADQFAQYHKMRGQEMEGK